MIPLNRNRNRTYPYHTLNGWIYRGVNLPSGNSQINYSTTLNDTAAGYKQPGWKRLVKLGIQAGTPYSRAAQAVEWNERGRLTMTYKVVDTTVNPNQVGSRTDYEVGTAGVSAPSSHSGTSDAAANRALSRLRMAIKAEYESTNALISLAEAREVVSQIRRPFSSMQSHIDKHFDRINNIFSRWIRKKPARWDKLSKKKRDAMLRDVMAESWLETSFGINPTLSDVVNISEAFAKWKSDADTRRSAVKGFHETVSANPPDVYYGLGVNSPYFRVDVVEKRETTHKVAYRAGIRVALSTPDSFRDLARLAGFQPENFVPTLYEVAPYSWLVDYFTTLGACLNANATVTRDVLWVIKSTLSRTTLRRISAPNWQYALSLGFEKLTFQGDLLGDWKTSLTTTSRELISPNELPSVKPEFKSLSEINPFQVANILALIQVKMRRTRTLTTQLRI